MVLDAAWPDLVPPLYGDLTEIWVLKNRGSSPSKIEQRE
jgi:hypothetical protein